MRTYALIVFLCLLLAVPGCAGKETPPAAPPTPAELAVQRRQAQAAEALTEAMQLRHDGGFLDEDTALAYLNQALDLDPNLANARYYRSTILFSKGRTNEALADVDRAIELKPEHVQAHYTRGSILLNLGRFREAARDFTEVIGHDPSIAQAFVRRGMCYMRLHREDEAIDDFGSALAINPANLEANYNRGMAYLARGEYDAALSDLSQAYVLDADNVRLLTARGQILLKLGRFKSAARDYLRATQLAPGQSPLYGLLAEALAGAGEMDQAIEAAEKALSLAHARGDDSLAARYRDQLRQYRDKTYP
ncbi:tetratricopeptide repeat protein [Pseudodesulfovibrio methanolicus]|uniref:Tetratricopeptide repeat protein n=1 Tax=Pseudodesulfovibrio methanolicus TaxID=3126690 RepID=A0ABZ2J030_9BACT